MSLPLKKTRSLCDNGCSKVYRGGIHEPGKDSPGLWRVKCYWCGNCWKEQRVL